MRIHSFSISLLTAPLLLISCQQAEISGKAKAAAQLAAKQSSTGPVVVELFQSQGCSSCPPANAALNAIADRSDVIALNFSVTYWDRLGWKDVFGDPEYTQRQYNYASALGDSNVYTPQVILNGKRAIVGNKPGEINRAVAATTGLSGGPAISVNGNTATIGAGSGKAAIWLVRYDPRLQNVAIKSGENTGRTLPHKNIVRQLVKLGDWNGKAATYTLPAAKSATYKSVVLTQRPGGGEIYSARVI
jgi:hypothetical protein